MSYFLKNYYRVGAVVATVATHGVLAASLSSMRGASTEGESKALVPASCVSTDFKDRAQAVASRLMAGLKSEKITSTFTREEKWDVLQQIRQHMIQYKNEHEDDLPIDRDGNRVAATLDRKESKFLYEPGLKGPLFIGDKKTILPILHQLFGTRTYNLSIKKCKVVSISSEGSSVVVGSEEGLLVARYRYNSTTYGWEHYLTVRYSDSVGRIKVPRFNSTTNCWEQHVVDYTDWINAVEVGLDDTVVAGSKNITQINQLGLTEQQLQELMSIVCKNADLALLLQNIHNKTKDSPLEIITLTHEQQNSLLTLPLSALEVLLRRYAINTDNLASLQFVKLPEEQQLKLITENPDYFISPGIFKKLSKKVQEIYNTLRGGPPTASVARPIVEERKTRGTGYPVVSIGGAARGADSAMAREAREDRDLAKALQRLLTQDPEKLNHDIRSNIDSIPGLSVQDRRTLIAAIQKALDSIRELPIEEQRNVVPKLVGSIEGLPVREQRTLTDLIQRSFQVRSLSRAFGDLR